MKFHELTESADTNLAHLWTDAVHAIIEANLTTAEIVQLFEDADKLDTLLEGNEIYGGLSPLEQRIRAQRQAAAQPAAQQPTDLPRRRVRAGVAPQQTSQQPEQQQSGSKIGNAFAAVKRVYNSIKSAIQNSAPVTAFDQKADQLLGKLKNSAGGGSGRVMQAVMKYRNFAKKHPVMQGVIYAALVGLTGLSGVGIGGAVLLGAVKMIDKLLQGNKASSALWSGFVTGAASAAVGQLGSAHSAESPSQGTDATTASVDHTKADNLLTRYIKAGTFDYDADGSPRIPREVQNAGGASDELVHKYGELARAARSRARY